MVLEDAVLALASYLWAGGSLVPVVKYYEDRNRLRARHDCIENLGEQPTIAVQGIYTCKKCGSDFIKEGAEYRRLNGKDWR